MKNDEDEVDAISNKRIYTFTNTTQCTYASILGFINKILPLSHCQQLLFINVASVSTLQI